MDAASYAGEAVRSKIESHGASPKCSRISPLGGRVGLPIGLARFMAQTFPAFPEPRAEAIPGERTAPALQPVLAVQHGGTDRSAKA
jgi:hypothetical protein